MIEVGDRQNQAEFARDLLKGTKQADAIRPARDRDDDPSAPIAPEPPGDGLPDCFACPVGPIVHVPHPLSATIAQYTGDEETDEP